MSVNADFALPSLSELISEFVGSVSSEDLSLGHITKAVIESPIEVQLTTGSGVLSLEGSTPTQTTKTTILPVWHRVRLTIVAQE
jgi:hypothetical protein